MGLEDKTVGLTRRSGWSTEQKHEWRNQRRVNGLCITCGQPSEEPPKQCNACRVRYRDYSSNRRAQLIATARCTQCGNEADVGLLCRTCRLAHNREKLRWRYHLTEEELVALEQVADGRCTFCGRVPSPRGRAALEIEHDHRTGQVRGLACASCNMYLRYSDEKEASVGIRG